MDKLEFGPIHISYSDTPVLRFLTLDEVDKWGNIIAQHAQKGAATGVDCGKMCKDCAFNSNQPKSSDYYEAVDSAVLMLINDGKFHCHTDDHEDAGRTCAGFLYAKLHFDTIPD